MINSNDWNEIVATLKSLEKFDVYDYKFISDGCSWCSIRTKKDIKPYKDFDFWQDGEVNTNGSIIVSNFDFWQMMNFIEFIKE